MQIIWKKANSPREVLPSDTVPEAISEAIAQEYAHSLKIIQATRENDLKLADYKERLAKENLDLLKEFLQKTVDSLEAEENRLKSNVEIARRKIKAIVDTLCQEHNSAEPERAPRKRKEPEEIVS